MKTLSVSRMLRLGSAAVLGTVFGSACDLDNLAAVVFQELGGVTGLVGQAMTALGINTV